MKVVIVDYRSGNLHSVLKSFQLASKIFSKAEVKVTSHYKDIETADRIVLPGVGSFKFCKSKLFENTILSGALHDAVLNKKTPFLGICVGMQLLASSGNEGKHHNKGLDWISGTVEKIDKESHNIKIPHMGWNNIDLNFNHELFSKISSSDHFYFVHSYYFKINNKANLLATTDYGSPLAAAVLKDNIFGVQFHPEKSQKPGIQLIKNFLSWKPN